MKISISLLIFLFILSSCKKNYIIYYNRVNEIDSIYRLANNPQLAIQKYRELFREYKPKNQERIEEYATYIVLADQYHEDFGGKRSLYKLIPLLAPYGEKYKNFYKLYQKYGIDSIEVKQKIDDWKKELNKRLIDSFTIAMIRDQESTIQDSIKHKLKIKKNTELLLWVFDHYGFPSLQEIGTEGNNGKGIPMLSFIDHLSESERYTEIKTQLSKYVKSGDCPPYIYGVMVDKHNLNFTQGKESMLYGAYKTTNLTFFDSVRIDRNRKSIGLPSLKHWDRLKRDFLSNLKYR